MVWLLVITNGHQLNAQGPEIDPVDQVGITINAFGVGGAARAGSWLGLNVSVISEGTPRAAVIVWEMGDPDGDIAEITTDIVLNPGMNVSAWLYGRLSYRDTLNTEWTLNVYPLDEDGNRINEVLGTHRFRATNLADSSVSFIGVLGMRPAGLGGYAFNVKSGAHPVGASERTEIITGIPIAGLPTRWMGLQQYEALVWIDPDPVNLRSEQAAALTEWVRRGGRLVIVVPELTQKWEMTLLTPILPEVEFLTLEDQEISNQDSAGGVLKYLKRPRKALNNTPLEGILTVPAQRREPRFPTVTLQLMRSNSDQGWGVTHTHPTMKVDDNFAAQTLQSFHGSIQPKETLTFAAERRVGFGMVTFVGVPVAHPLLNRNGLDLPQADVFWNRILARRQDTPTPTEVQAVEANREFNGARDERPIGRVLPTSIMLKSQGTGGFLLALVLFIFYWVISGPLAYGVLKNKGMQSQSWLAFALAGVVFSGIGWGAARILRSQGILPRHLTIVDHVYGEEWERSLTFVTTSLEGYGTQTIAAEQVDLETEAEFYDTVYALTDPHKAITPFPDPRRYVVDSNDQHSIAYPARSTAKQLVIESMHAPMPGWGMPTYNGEANKPAIVHSGDPLDLPSLSGTLTHTLPGTLRNVNVVFVSNQEFRRLFTEGFREDGKSLAATRLKTFSWALPGSWSPGQELPLATTLDTGARDAWFSNTKAGIKDDVERISTHYRTSYGVSSANNFSAKNLRMDIRALSFYRYLDQPQWAGKIQNNPKMMVRQFGRELDLSNWLNRPCLIITGYLEAPDDPQDLPTPISIDGDLMDRTATNSHVFVRWIYPFPAEK